MNNIVSRDVTFKQRPENALTNVIGRCKRHDFINVVLLFQHPMCVNSLFSCKCDRLDNFSASERDECKSLIFLMFMEYEPQWVASKTYMYPFRVHSLCMGPTVVYSSMTTRKKEIHFLNTLHLKNYIFFAFSIPVGRATSKPASECFYRLLST